MKKLPKGAELAAQWQKTGLIALRDRGLTELPDSAVASVGESARVLDAGGNRLTRVSASILAPLTGLNRLVLSNNELTAAPAGLPASLKIVVLSNNRIPSLPPGAFAGLMTMQRLELNSNHLDNIPVGVFAALRSLEVLLLDSNRLRALPEDLGTCESLAELSAQNNQIIDIPPALGQLQKLRTLNLTNNLVRRVPPEVLKGCAALQTLQLHGNPIKPNELQETDGFQEFEARRQGKYTKAIASGAMMPSRGLDEGVDRRTTRE